jgi:hypothetical protein
MWRTCGSFTLSRPTDSIKSEIPTSRARMSVGNSAKFSVDRLVQRLDGPRHRSQLYQMWYHEGVCELTQPGATRQVPESSARAGSNWPGDNAKVFSPVHTLHPWTTALGLVLGSIYCPVNSALRGLSMLEHAGVPPI